MQVCYALVHSIASRRLFVCFTCAVMKPWPFKSRLYSAALRCFPSLMLRACSSPRLGPLLFSSRKISLSRRPQPGSRKYMQTCNVKSTNRKNKSLYKHVGAVARLFPYTGLTESCSVMLTKQELIFFYFIFQQ